MRTFSTSATRDGDENKFDIEGFLSPIVIERYCQYLHKHRIQADGKMRDSDNWQKGMPRAVYLKSLLRHLLDAWKYHRGYYVDQDIQDSLCGIVFNAMGYLYEILKTKEEKN